MNLADLKLEVFNEILEYYTSRNYKISIDQINHAWENVRIITSHNETNDQYFEANLEYYRSEFISFGDGGIIDEVNTFYTQAKDQLFSNDHLPAYSNERELMHNVAARCFDVMFYKFFRRLKINPHLELTGLDKATPATSGKASLSLRKIALIHVYRGVPITRENCNEIALENGYKSGEKLRILYGEYKSASNRKGTPTPCTPRKLRNKIDLFESVLPHLSDADKQRALSDIQTLNTHFENLYK